MSSRNAAALSVENELESASLSERGGGGAVVECCRKLTCHVRMRTPDDFGGHFVGVSPVRATVGPLYDWEKDAKGEGGTFVVS